ncbi:uncharacterized protein LOC127546887 [Antechinus flavipes]|uniref:uncharacterized protein LOC127546887 n=1 Tax=Antechinus flavipes TaxID=38775 RepID=UPI002236318E|nr:uncharacterized protein LOC127546887 [Antechinus flavipes]
MGLEALTLTLPPVRSHSLREKDPDLEWIEGCPLGASALCAGTEAARYCCATALESRGQRIGSLSTCVLVPALKSGLGDNPRTTSHPALEPQPPARYPLKNPRAPIHLVSLPRVVAPAQGELRSTKTFIIRRLARRCRLLSSLEYEKRDTRHVPTPPEARGSLWVTWDPTLWVSLQLLLEINAPHKPRVDPSFRTGQALSPRPVPRCGFHLQGSVSSSLSPRKDEWMNRWTDPVADTPKPVPTPKLELSKKPRTFKNAC